MNLIWLDAVITGSVNSFKPSRKGSSSPLATWANQGERQLPFTMFEIDKKRKENKFEKKYVFRGTQHDDIVICFCGNLNFWEIII